MCQRILIIVLICLLSSVSQSLSSQTGPSIQVAAVFDENSLKWTNHITVSDQDGIHSAAYRTPGRDWQSLNVDPLCNKIMTWVVETRMERIRDVRAEDCAFCGPDTITHYRSQWHYDSIYNKTDEAAYIVVGWMFETPKEELRIVSVRVTSGDLTDENGEPLDPSDFVATGGGFVGFVGKVKGSGTLEIIMDPEGDLNIFVYDIYSDLPDIGFIQYIIGAICGIIFLAILLFIIRKTKTK